MAHYADNATVMAPGIHSAGKDAIRKTVTSMAADPAPDPTNSKRK